MSEQHMEALQKAQRIKSARTALKYDLKNERVGLAEVLTDEFPDWLENMPIGKLLYALPRFPTKLAAQFCADCPISEMQPVGRATTRQRNWLAAAVLSWEARRDGSREKDARRATSREKVAA